ncbi:aldehyde dehydrogenase [Stereum hirsutum FP-91666 SS1]|uniref:aldehyde dehydrogenase n=1 Tax=Stereum hirsutum (strain FP-91666) TaxID=721885 RepID=UPI000440B12A|nr:aldehyde dehydrogenase [Stereum hirsutum FP-91666 SS1]EIM91723.1 aldehyde dehydrogenase [Stereum hirsutum FP-91666 SS1]
MSHFNYTYDTPVFKGTVDFPTGVFIGGKFQEGSSKSHIDVINPTNGKVITSVAEATREDVDTAVKVAHEAFETVWGLNAPGSKRAALLNNLANLMEKHKDELAAIEALDNGKTFSWAKAADLTLGIDTIKYYAGWADKIQGKVIETTNDKLAYTRHEPIGVVGQICAWNFPLMLMCWKIGPALACGNTIVFKPSEFTPLTALRMASLINEAGFPPGVVNILVGYGPTVGDAMSSHMDIEKLSFTGSTLVGRKIMERAAQTNLKDVTLELGGKSPNIIFNDADLDLAIDWSSHGIFWNHGQACCAGSRIFVQSGIYDEFLKKFTAKAASIKLGDPFAHDSYQGPQVSQQQYDRIMSYIDSGKSEGATVHLGGARHGEEGYWIEPTIFTDTKPNMKIVQEEIFGPVGVVIKFEDEDDVLKQANDTMYGLAAAVFTQDISRGLDVAHRLKAGTAWINCANQLHANIPFGGFKQSGIGRELGEYAIQHYTSVKAVHVNVGKVRI